MLRISDASPYSDQLYARGYVLRRDTEPVAPAHWRRDVVCGHHLAHDPRLTAYRANHAGCEVLALGIIVDVRNPDESTHGLLTRLAEALSDSEEAFHRLLDHAGGRYVLIYAGGGTQPAIVADAAGMRAVFYHTGRPGLVVSHPNLVCENAPQARPTAPLESKFGYPGLRAPISDTFMLTPNARLDLATLTPARVWPRDPLPERDVPSAAEIVRTTMQGMVRYVRAHHPQVLSITAGLDSRVTLSFLKDAADIRLFTYFRKDGMDTDTADLGFAEVLKKDLGREVEILRLSKGKQTPDDFKSLTRANTFIQHQPRLAWILFDRFGAEENLVHLRSNISEVGREFWGGKQSPMRSGIDLARIYLRVNQSYEAQYVFQVIDRFEEFDRLTGLSRCRDLVDLKSLFYWEFRMASWHAQLVCESDPAFETLSLFNCRATLEAMLSVPRQERANGNVLRHVIAANWPALADYPVNGKPFWPSPVHA